MLDRLKEYIIGKRLFNDEESILLAVSGGIDSMVMAHLFFTMKNRMGIAHCNFSLRGEESDRDEEMVQDLAKRYRKEFFSVRFDTRSFAAEKRLSLQMAARELRYRWFEETREENGFDKIAVGHNLNDNAETMLINLTRGTGTAGLSGMKPLSNRIIRPLLFATREEITEYCRKNNIPFREDRTNSETKYFRNKIRHLVIPVLKQINPSVENNLNDTAGIIHDVERIVADYINDLREKIIEEEYNIKKINTDVLKAYLDNRTILFELFRPYGITGTGIDDLVNVITGRTGAQIFTGTHRIIKNRDQLIIAHNKEQENNSYYTLHTIEELQESPFIESASLVRIIDDFQIPSDPLTACLDYEKISFPLKIRRWRHGDLFCPLGMTGEKKLSDYFIDRKYSLLDKENACILESADKIIWVIGDRIDNRVRITGSSREALVIRAQGMRHGARGTKRE